MAAWSRRGEGRYFNRCALHRIERTAPSALFCCSKERMMSAMVAAPLFMSLPFLTSTPLPDFASSGGLRAAPNLLVHRRYLHVNVEKPGRRRPTSWI